MKTATRMKPSATPSKPPSKRGSTKTKTSSSKVAPLPSVSEDEIRETAYHIYLNRLDCGLKGAPKDDWLQAEEYCKNSEYAYPA